MLDRDMQDGDMSEMTRPTPRPIHGEPDKIHPATQSSIPVVMGERGTSLVVRWGEPHGVPAPCLADRQPVAFNGPQPVATT
jgi:hypothetical protein